MIISSNNLKHPNASLNNLYCKAKITVLSFKKCKETTEMLTYLQRKVRKFEEPMGQRKKKIISSTPKASSFCSTDGLAEKKLTGVL